MVIKIIGIWGTSFHSLDRNPFLMVIFLPLSFPFFLVSVTPPPLLSGSNFRRRIFSNKLPGYFLPNFVSSSGITKVLCRSQLECPIKSTPASVTLEIPQSKDRSITCKGYGPLKHYRREDWKIVQRVSCLFHIYPIQVWSQTHLRAHQTWFLSTEPEIRSEKLWV